MASNDGESDRDHGKIVDQLDRILQSSEFQAPERGRRFLRYVVEEALEGRSEQLNAYVIAQAVFGRNAGFDAQSDPVVRIEAGRIRRALERYYLVSGSNDPVRITIPKGHYAPSFEWCEQRPESGAVNNTGLAQSQSERQTTYRDLLVPIGVPSFFAALTILALVRPLQHYFEPPPRPTAVSTAFNQQTKIVVGPLEMFGTRSDGLDMALGLSDQLISRLAKIDGVAVIAPLRSVATPSEGSVLNLQGSIAFENNSVQIQIRLTRGADGVVVWAKRYDHDMEGRSVLDLQDEIAKLIVSDISKIPEIPHSS